MSEAGQPNAATMELCFWEAVKRCVEDENVPVNVSLCADGDLGGIHLGPKIPPELWHHMAAVHAELRTAAGV